MTTDAAPPPPSWTGHRAVLWLGCLIPLAAAIHLVVWYWPGAIPLDVTSGVWTALAKDTADGILYRPLVGPDGYGGTRYMPLFFVAHGALIRLGLDPVSAGAGLMLATAVLFDLALFRTLRELGVRRGIAIPLAVLAHAAAAVQILTLNIKCDLLAAALNLGGIALALRHVRRPRGATLAASVTMLVAAFFTKFTTVSGLVALLALLARKFGRRVALAVAAVVAVLLTAGLEALYIASDGRVWTSFLAVGSGGIHLAYAVRFPFWFALLLAEDPCALLIVLAALFYAVQGTRERRGGFPVAYFWLVLALTVPVFASPGTDNNHLIDLLAASILVLGDELEHRAPAAAWARAVPVALAALTLSSYVPGVISVRSVIMGMGRPERRDIATILSRSGPPDRILSENPLVPILGGGHAVVSDAFSLRILAASRPDIREDFARRMTDGEFKTVVLLDPSGADRAHVLAALESRRDRGVDRFYGGERFPAGFLALLERDYVVTAIAHPFVTFERVASAP